MARFAMTNGLAVVPVPEITPLAAVKSESLAMRTGPWAEPLQLPASAAGRIPTATASTDKLTTAATTAPAAFLETESPDFSFPLGRSKRPGYLRLLHSGLSFRRGPAGGGIPGSSVRWTTDPAGAGFRKARGLST